MQSATKIVPLSFLIVALGAGVFGLWKLRQGNERLRTRVSELRRETSEGERETERARREVAERERQAQISHDEKLARAGANEENRDPEKGFARLEYFQNSGRATVSAAFQTVVWAALKGEDTMLVAGLTVTDAARTKAAELRERLPEEMRIKYPAPESLAAIVVTNEILKTPAVQVMGYTLVDPQHATLTVRQLSAAGQEMKMPMELGPGGWRLVVSDKVIETLNERMRETGPNR
jgi:hypothetical protein